jgi:hypothetical protein
VNPLLPLAALIDERVPQPHACAQIEDVLGRDPRLRQPVDHHTSRTAPPPLSRRDPFETSAIGAEHRYRRWPDAHRPETEAQAAETDLLCARAWKAHPDYVQIDNDSRGWPTKARVAHDILERWVSTVATP